MIVHVVRKRETHDSTSIMFYKKQRTEKIGDGNGGILKGSVTAEEKYKEFRHYLKLSDAIWGSGHHHWETCAWVFENHGIVIFSMIHYELWQLKKML